MLKRATMVAGLPILLLSACSGSVVHYDDPTERYENPAIKNSVEAIIASEAQAAVRSQEVLARIERTKAPPTVSNPNDGAPDDLRQNVSELNWAGPAEGLVRALAEKVGYSYLPVPMIEATPIMVNLSIVDRSVAEALDAVSLQIQDQATIVVDTGKKTMTLRLKGQEGQELPPSSIPKKKEVKRRHHSAR